MSREILFRGKRIDNLEWVYGSLCIVKDGNLGFKYPNIVISYNHETFDWFDINPKTLGQFTGRKTIGSNKIFEGDIVYVDDSGIGGMPHEMKGGTYKVIWNDIEAMFLLELLDGSNAITFDECCVYSILGNIHDNPDLIEV